MTFRLSVILVAGLVCAVGCGPSGPPLAPVEGVVTLDGAPLDGALLEFQPDSRDGSPSYGETDAEGRYQMKFSQSLDGAWVGDHTVRITTLNENARVRERVPRAYNEESTLRETVQANQTNEIDFALSTEPPAER